MTPSLKSKQEFADIWIEAKLFQSRFEEGNVILYIHGSWKEAHDLDNRKLSE